MEPMRREDDTKWNQEEVRVIQNGTKDKGGYYKIKPRRRE